MDDRRFDSLARSLATGVNRRSILKGLLGLGVVAVAESPYDSEAARRSKPTPKPVSCPGDQVWDGSACVCASGSKCGPDCCDEGSTCCDNACCAGECYGEELCCPTGSRVCDGACTDWECCAGSDCSSGICNEDHTCCQPSCPAGICDDGCGGSCPCSDGQSCISGICCTNDGGTCDTGADCCNGSCPNGICCQPFCPASTCGADGCGGACSCSDGEACYREVCWSANVACNSNYPWIGTYTEDGFICTYPTTSFCSTDDDCVAIYGLATICLHGKGNSCVTPEYICRGAEEYCGAGTWCCSGVCQDDSTCE